MYPVCVSQTGIESRRQPSKSVLVGSLVARFFLADHSLGDELGKALIQGLHALLGTGLDGGVHLRDLAFADEVSDGGRADHDFMRRDTATAVALQQCL